MLRNYLKIALRHVRREKGYSLINVLGLAIGMACCLPITLYVRDELFYDRFHENSERIARLVRESSAMTAAPMGPALADDLPEATTPDFCRLKTSTSSPAASGRSKKGATH